MRHAGRDVMKLWRWLRIVAVTLAISAGAGFLLCAVLDPPASATGNRHTLVAPTQLSITAHASRDNLKSKPVSVCGSTTGELIITSHETWTAASSPYIVSCLVTIARGGEITMDPGTVVKVGLDGLGNDFYVEPGGSLDVAGTAKAPVVVTSFLDNSVGGATAPDDSPHPGQDYRWAFLFDGGSSLRISHADIRYGISTVNEGTPSGSCTATRRVNLSITDSTLTSPVVLGACDAARGSRYDLRDNTFTMTSGTTALSDRGFPSDSLTLTSNSFDFTGASASTVALQITNANVDGVDLSGSATNTFHDSSSPVSLNMTSDVVPARHSWTVNTGKKLSLSGSLSVEGSLALDAGTSLTSAAAITLGSHASLRVEGTAARPVAFSGGASISTSGNSSLSVDHAVFSGDLGGNVIQEANCVAADGGATTTIKNSTIGGDVFLGNCDRSGGDRYSIEDNTFDNAKGFNALSLTVASNYPANPGRLIVAKNTFSPVADIPADRLGGTLAMQVTIAGWAVNGVALSGRSSNVFTGEGVSRVVGVHKDVVPATAGWELSPSSGAVLVPGVTIGFNSSKAPGVVVDGTLKLDPGFVVKIGTDSVSAGGIDLGAGGSLIALGTSARPIVFTSSSDDSIDGNSNGSPAAKPTQSDYQVAVQSDEGSTVDVAHAKFRDGLFAFYDQCGAAPQNGGRFALTASLIDDEMSVGDCNGSQHGYIAQVVGNTFGPSFDGAPSGQFAIGGGYDPTALQPAVYLQNIDPSFFALSGPNANVFKGKGAGKVVALQGTTIGSAERWTVSSSSGAVIGLWEDLDYLTDPSLTVDGSLVVMPGTILKGAWPGVGVDITESGVLNLGGTASTPVVFTSVNDDTLGGDSNGNGSASTAKTGDYGTAIQFEHLSGPRLVSHVVFEYASDALSYLFMSHYANIYDSDFAHNSDAVDVENTSGHDYAGVGNVPCTPPWFWAVNSDDNWFIYGGNPAPSIDLSGLNGSIPDSISFGGSVTDLAGAASSFDLEKTSFGLGNTVPWTIYACAKVKFPWPAVNVSGTPGAPHYPKIDPKHAKLAHYGSK